MRVLSAAMAGPRLMQGMMSLGYLWRLAEERVGPASKPLSDAEAVGLAPMLWDSEVIKKSSDLWVSATFAWIVEQGFSPHKPDPCIR